MKRILLVFGGLVTLPAMLLGQSGGMSAESQRALVNQYCAPCHNDAEESGGFSWTEVNLNRPEQNAEQVEKVIRKLRSGMMPPAGATRPDADTVKAFASALEWRIDQADARQPYV